MAITIADIAKTVGVHQSTVSTVLNNSRSTIRISERTRARILETARQLNYRPSFSARALAKGRTFSIGMICGDIHSPHFSELASRAMQEVESRGYHLLLTVTQWVTMENNLDCLGTMINRGVDGVLAWGSGLEAGTSLHDYVIREKFPVVLYAESVQGLSSIDSDWETGMSEAVEHLASKGHRRITFLGYFDHAGKVDTIWDPKQPAFRQACRTCGVEGREAYLSKLSDLEEAEEFGMRLAADADRSTAYIVYSDYVAMGFMRGLINRGLKVPEDVAVIGFDGTKIGRFFSPSLTTITQDREAMIVRGVDMVIKMIEKKEEPGRRILLPTTLVRRESA